MARRPILSIPQTTSPITFAAFGDLLATDRIAHVLAAAKAITHRQRKLSLVFTAQLCIAMSLWSDESIDDIARKLLDGPRVRGTLRADAIPSAGAICRRRQTLGVAPLQALFTTICRPMATTTTADAFRWGMRLMAIDGTTEEVPDTPANSAAFGRASGSRGDGSFPQLQLVYLCEVGTHAIVDVVWGPYADSERVGGVTLLRSVEPGMLLLWDGAFQTLAMSQACRQRGAHFLGRLPRTVKPQVEERLADGSYLMTLRAHWRRGKPKQSPLMVRVIEYELTDPNRPGYREVRRLATSLLDAAQYPATALVLTYHERWEIELVVDELDTHQRQPRQPFRSRTPDGVVQELYGMLIAHYAIRTSMHALAGRLALPPDRLSFVRCVRLLREWTLHLLWCSVRQRTRLLRQLDHALQGCILRARVNRGYPREVKRKMSRYLRKRPGEPPWPQPTKPFAESFNILGVPPRVLGHSNA